MTNVGPLTTIFTPPATCIDVITSASNVLYIGAFRSFDSSCYPTTKSAGLFGDTWYMSPGICPQGYTTACAYPSGNLDIFSGTTASLCCPTGYGCTLGGHADYAKVCVSTATTSLTNIWSSPTPFAIPASLSLTSVTGTSHQIFMNGIPVLWQSTDQVILGHLASITGSTSNSIATKTTSSFPSATTGTTSSGSAAAGASSQATGTTSTPSQNAATVSVTVSASSESSSAFNGSSTADNGASTDKASSGIPWGAKVVVGIVIVLLALVGIGAAFWLFLRRRNNKIVSPPHHCEEFRGVQEMGTDGAVGGPNTICLPVGAEWVKDRVPGSPYADNKDGRYDSDHGNTGANAPVYHTYEVPGTPEASEMGNESAFSARSRYHELG